MNEIITRIKEAIAGLKTTANAFAVKAKIDPSNFGKMLEGKQTITDKTIAKLCSAHNLSVEWIKSGAGEMLASKEVVKGNLLSPDGLYIEDYEITVGDAVLSERVKNLQNALNELKGEKKAWKEERKGLMKDIEELRKKVDDLNAEVSRSKDQMIKLLMEGKK